MGLQEAVATVVSVGRAQAQCSPGVFEREPTFPDRLRGNPCYTGKEAEAQKGYLSSLPKATQMLFGIAEVRAMCVHVGGGPRKQNDSESRRQGRKPAKVNR